jgi:hypothetical protein
MVAMCSRALRVLVVGLAALLPTTAAGAERRSRLFDPPRRPALPAVKHRAWVANPIDAFILARLEARGLAPSARAGRLRLLRRVTFDLTGLPPSLAEQEAFLKDKSPNAYRKVVERLLASPAHGERWAQHWLDLVRYAESDGFKEDALRLDAHKFRDYVIGAFNADEPFDVFVRRQLAGDELEPDNPDALIATGFNRLWPDEYNAANLEQRRQEILDDTTDTAGLVFLGLTVGCARCHDHKYDPISQKEYFRLQAFFAPMQPRDLPAVDPAARRAHDKRQAEWEAATREVRDEMDKMLAGKRAALRRGALNKFRPEIQKAVLTPPDKRTPYQRLIAQMAEKQMERAELGAAAKLPPADRKRYQELRRRLDAVPRPPPLPRAMAVTDVGAVGPPTFRLVGGDWRKPAARVLPGFPAFLGKAKPDMKLPPGRQSTGSRAALARWLTRADHPLTARVMVNRLWQHHFGVGIVATPNDFGAQGSAPTHPELLDWLAVELVEKGWSLKHLHRLMVTSASYCQDSAVDPRDANHARALRTDRGNALLWHARRRRLEGEPLRDALLSVSGELARRMYGPSARPRLPAKISKYAWKPDERPEDRHRRSIYVLVRRNLRYPLFDAFDQPDLHNSCGRRLTTTTAPQALLLLNGDFTLNRARRWAETLRGRHAENDLALVADAYRAAWGRPAGADEVRLGLRFLRAQAERQAARLGEPGAARDAALADFCHALLNTNEFLYLD